MRSLSQKLRDFADNEQRPTWRAVEKLLCEASDLIREQSAEIRRAFEAGYLAGAAQATDNDFDVEHIQAMASLEWSERNAVSDRRPVEHYDPMTSNLNPHEHEWGPVDAFGWQRCIDKNCNAGLPPSISNSADRQPVNDGFHRVLDEHDCGDVRFEQIEPWLYKCKGCGDGFSWTVVANRQVPPKPECPQNIVVKDGRLWPKDPGADG